MTFLSDIMGAKENNNFFSGTLYVDNARGVQKVLGISQQIYLKKYNILISNPVVLKGRYPDIQIRTMPIENFWHGVSGVAVSIVEMTDVDMNFSQGNQNIRLNEIFLPVKYFHK